MMETSSEPAKVLNAEIDVRSYFSAFDFPKLPEVIQAIEHVFSTDVTKVVKALRGPLMGLYRIQARDYSLYKNKTITLRGKNVPVVLRTAQPKAPREGVLVTIYDAYTPSFQNINGKEFDKYFLEFEGMSMIRQTTTQFSKGTRVLNGNRYFIANFNAETVDLGECAKLGGTQFKIQYSGMKRFCFLCNKRHGQVCKSKQEFDRMRENRKDKITHTIYTDSTLRHVNQLALAANVACTSGGGIGQIANAVIADPEKVEKVIIMAGANDIRNTLDHHEFTYAISKASEKLHALTKNKEVTFILPTAPVESVEEKAKYLLLKETMLNCRSITVAEIPHQIDYSDNHPSPEGTRAIIGSIESAMEVALILENDHVTTERRYSQVQALYKMGCRTCDSPLYTQSKCDNCKTVSKTVDITRLDQLIKEVGEAEFPPGEDSDANMAEINKRGDSHTGDYDATGGNDPKKRNVGGEDAGDK